MSTGRLYSDLAAWWPLMSAPADYEEEAEIYTQLLREACARPPATLLELGAGGGNNACFMKNDFSEVVLTDIAPGMLKVSRKLNPDLEHIQGDMRDLRLNRQFDAVFLHDAICYMTSRDDLERVAATAWEHCRPGGAALFAPDYVKEAFPGSDTEHGGEDAPHIEPGDLCARGLRYLAWAWDPDPADEQYLTDYSYLLRHGDGTVETVHDRHVEGLFARSVWRCVLEGAGFEIEVVPLEHSEVEPGVHEMFVGRRPLGS